MTQPDLLSWVWPNDNGCHIWMRALNSDGYGGMRLGRAWVKVHRVAWERANGPIPAGQHVCHHCDVPACVNPAHLFLGTHADNMADKVAKNRCARLRGDESARARLTSSDVDHIRKAGVPASALAKHYGVSKGHINRIRRREQWGHL